MFIFKKLKSDPKTADGRVALTNSRETHGIATNMLAVMSRHKQNMLMDRNKHPHYLKFTLKDVHAYESPFSVRDRKQNAVVFFKSQVYR